MLLIADFHIHSYLSRATSKQMNVEQLSRNAKLKGLHLLGSGDFSHPIWLRELKEKLQPVDDSGLFEYGGILWMLTNEVATIYTQDGKVRKVHHVIHAPSFEIVDQINEQFAKYGNLTIDGRPMFNGMTSPELVELLMEISDRIFVYPAHAWTSWYGVLGEFSGFNSLEECYEEQTKHIHALETGMSSDPPMNWRLSALDRVTLLSNSDAHSPWTWRIGREANAFEFDKSKVTYDAIHDAIKKKDKKRFLFTVETNPSYGKYHYTGHRRCGINLHPSDALKLGNICPRCGRKLTIGVLQRVEKLADRPEGFRPNDAIDYKDLLPLYEIISFVTGVNQLYSRKVVEEQERLIKRFGNEFHVLLNAPKEELIQATKESIADAIIKVREGKVKYIPGYDGVYGRPVFSEQEFERLKKQHEAKAREQRNLRDFG